MHRAVMPASLAAPAANYAHAVLSTGTTRWLHTSGVVPVAPDGTTPGPLGEQAALVWANIGVMLTDVGMGPDDVVAVTTYVVGGHPLAPVMTARDEFLGGRRAASTLVTVPALARPEWAVEVAVVAAD